MPAPLKKLYAFAVIMLLLLMAGSVSAHDLPMGGSRWCFGKSNIVGSIDLKPSLFSLLPGIKEGHYNIDSISDEQLRKITVDIIQPYIDKKLSIKIDDKNYPVKVDKLTRNADNLYTIWLSVNNAVFTGPENHVTIRYSLLFNETNNDHINLAYGYLTDATGATLQKVFDYTPPSFQTTFDAGHPSWEVSVKGPASAPFEEHKAATPNASSSSESARNHVAKGRTADKPEAPAAVPAHSVNQQTLNNKPAVSSPSSMSELAPESKPQDKNDAPISDDPVGGSVWTTIREFIPLGIEHILTGYDHIAFLLALIVIGLSFKEVLKIITAFTAAHSITLLLAALQIIRLDSRFVESVIALSICYVTVENLFKKEVNYRWVITFVFGLVHGFGFASALQELIVGKSNLLLSVLSFNAGVEIGQLMIVCVMLPVLYLLSKKFELRMITAGASVSIFILGFAWFIERVFDLKILWF